MKKTISILLLCAVVITALCIWQRNNIKAVMMFLTNDEEAVEKIIEENNKDLEEKIKDYTDVVPRYFTPEEEAMIANGELSLEEATALLLGEDEQEEKVNSSEEDASDDGEDERTDETGDETKEADGKNDNVEDKKPSDDKTGGGKADGKKPSDDKAGGGKADGKKPSDDKAGSDKTVSAGDENTIIRNYTAQFYGLKAYYIGRLGQLETLAKNEYASLSKEQKSSTSKAAIAAKYIGQASALQGECDGKVNSLLATMKEELKAAGGDLSIIDTIKQAYEAEKTARKAQYMNMIK